MGTEKCEKTCGSVGAKELFIGGVIGGLIGAAAALLLAPKSGEEIRKDLHIKELVANGIDKVKQTASDLVKKDEEPFS
ncbi:YtxH domain-containing protein [Sporolactobacillus shoreae]|uniref:YtxH domain-containing protein n=1 Tax=Sporolactobacillus shoreae TaxID=1465501 RepID=A0A4Z0GU54_9BACL|nr:YtxH domain-containing protein [Sporolactobacillus shoreae]TGB00137.1 YtxH domain-containing protein [Sporolactobacillus shoreae]